VKPAFTTQSASFVNVAAVADVMELDAAQLHVELIEHAVIAYSEFAFGRPCSRWCGKGSRQVPISSTFALHGFADGSRQGSEGA
jgi:hypothetical protein